MQNCWRMVESKQAQECHRVSNENYHYMKLEPTVMEEVFQQLLPLAQQWIGDKVELAGTSVYGIRNQPVKLMARILFYSLIFGLIPVVKTSICISPSKLVSSPPGSIPGGPG